MIGYKTYAIWTNRPHKTLSVSQRPLSCCSGSRGDELPLAARGARPQSLASLPPDSLPRDASTDERIASFQRVLLDGNRNHR